MIILHPSPCLWHKYSSCLARLAKSHGAAGSKRGRYAAGRSCGMHVCVPTTSVFPQPYRAAHLSQSFYISMYCELRDQDCASMWTMSMLSWLNIHQLRSGVPADFVMEFLHSPVWKGTLKVPGSWKDLGFLKQKMFQASQGVGRGVVERYWVPVKIVFVSEKVP